MRSADQQPIDSTGPRSGPHQDGPTCEVKAYNAAPTGAPRTSWRAMALASWPGASAAPSAAPPARAVSENYIDNAESVSGSIHWPVSCGRADRDRLPSLQDRGQHRHGPVRQGVPRHQDQRRRSRLRRSVITAPLITASSWPAWSIRCGRPSRRRMACRWLPSTTGRSSGT